MDDLQTVNVKEKDNNIQSAFADILHVLRANLLLIIIVTLLFAAGGYIFSRLKQPTYTASVPVQFEVEINAVDEKTGADLGKVDQVASTNYLFAYLDTAVGFCVSGKVLDRANVYYYYYKNSNKKLDGFIDELSKAYEENKTTSKEIPGYPMKVEATGGEYDLQDVYRNKWFTVNNVGTVYTSNKEKTVINFSLWVRSDDGQMAREMARIYALAADVALNETVDFGSDDADATSGIMELNKSSRGVSVSSDVAPKKIITIAAFIGVVVSLALIYILYLLDNTVKSKEQLEAMTGASVISYIDDVTEAK